MATKKRKHDGAARSAHQKNVEQAKYRARAEKRKAFMDKYRRKILICAAAAIVLIAGGWLLCKALIGPDGSIPNFFGHLQGVQDNWIVTNLGTSAAPRYYQMGTFTAPEGYTRDPEAGVSNDALAQTFYYNADDASAPIQTFYVTGVAGKTAAQMADSLIGFGLYSGEEVKHEGQIGGLNAVWLQERTNDDENAEAQSEDSEESEEAPELVIGHRQMTVYADTGRGGCVMVYLYSTPSTPAEDIPSEEDFMAAAESILAHLKVV